jgi:protein subunit release factor B
VDRIEDLYRTWAGTRSFTWRRVHDDPTTAHVTLHVEGPFAYAWLRGEAGLHRLSRKAESDGASAEADTIEVRVLPDVEGLPLPGWDPALPRHEELKHFDRRGVS